MIPSPKGSSKLIWKLFAGYAILMVAALAVSALFVIREVEKFNADELADHLRMQAELLGRQASGLFNPEGADRLDQIAAEVGQQEGVGPRVTFVAADGAVLGDSWADARFMESHDDRVEIREALEDGWGRSARWSDTLKRNLMYVAVRIGAEDAPEGYVRVALPVKTVGAKTQAVRDMVWTIALVAMAAGALFALMLANLWTRPIRTITRIAARLSRGELDARAPVNGSDEMAWLAQSLNEMGDHLSKQLKLIDGQRRTLEALLNQLQEGVVVAGPNGKIILANPTAARLLRPDDREGADTAGWIGKSVEVCVPQLELQRLLLSPEALLGADHKPPRSDDPPAKPDPRASSEVRIEIPRDSGPLVLLARGSDITIPDRMVDAASRSLADQPCVGRILALTDITEIARLIQIKTDFVANASHELRTPLSAIRAAVDTLNDINACEDVESVKRFIGVIDRQSARLQAMVGDLLALSRLESATNMAKTASIDLRRFCRDLSERWADRLKEKRLHWKCDLPPGPCEIVADSSRLGVVLDNLVDNAVKFTPPGGHIAVAFTFDNDAVRIEVADDGCGVPPGDRERVFERFYQVEQARAGGDSSPSEKRGTGLGLSIVRHAVASMGGQVALDSEAGAGTKVTVIIPQ